jgi:hypothetical protein
MISHHATLFAWLFPVILAAPWIVASIAYWQARPRDGFVPPSHAELSLRR